MNHSKSNVTPFLNDQTFFITGSTGLLGKVLLLKILLSAPDAKIYLLIRRKKDVNPAERFERMCLDSLILEEYAINHPGFYDNVTVLGGDVGYPNLGLSDDDYNLVCNTCTCILHLAATVNFDEPLKVAFSLNVLGTMEVLNLARNCTNLKSVVHVSTAYVNSIRFNLDLVKEKVYPIDFDPYEMIDYVMDADEDELERDCKKIIGDHPNTYTFSKSIAENIILHEKGKLPICMVRPSMISGADIFPYKGWVDSFIGPAGLILAFGVGALKTVKAKKHLIPDFVPVDYVVNAILVASYQTATFKPEKQLPIYHLVSGEYGTLSWSDVLNIGKGYFRRNPTRRAIGFPWLFFSSNSLTFWFANGIFHLAPAAIKDGQRLITGKQPKMLSASKKLQASVERLSFFTTNSWNFGLKKVLGLAESLNEEDSRLYNFDIRNLDWETYMIHFLTGLKMFLLKEAHDKASVSHKL